MYKHTRQEAADLLQVSTRTIDRYVESGKLRAKKDWKVVYINTADLENLSWAWTQKQEIIIEKKAPEKKQENKAPEVKKETKAKEDVEIKETIAVAELSTKKPTTLDGVYMDLKSEIREKDKIITELSIRLWQAEEIAKNSVSLIDYKKSQFLLETSRSNLNQNIIDLESDKNELEKELGYQKINNIIMLLALVFLFAVAGTIFFLKV